MITWPHNSSSPTQFCRVSAHHAILIADVTPWHLLLLCTWSWPVRYQTSLAASQMQRQLPALGLDPRAIAAISEITSSQQPPTYLNHITNVSLFAAPGPRGAMRNFSTAALPQPPPSVAAPGPLTTSPAHQHPILEAYRLGHHLPLLHLKLQQPQPWSSQV